MNVFGRGLQAYLLALTFIASLTVVWGTNRFLLDNTTAGTGWPLMIAITGATVTLWIVFRRWKATDERESASDQYPWSSRE